ncbi:hypothetical protein DY000_02061405 [Brassica cretica]|uniref:Hexosyltransferase n=1 Tax=Brassica cretica TaxID=69181 RepID=A0ABQ7AQW4_BRACR|nr:hypothetical protein DY000_02061405 [Brassica cretica]
MFFLYCACAIDDEVSRNLNIFKKKAVGGSNSDINNLDGLIGLRGGLWKREIENELDHRSLRIRIFQLRHLSEKCDCSVSGGEICYEECRPWKHVFTNLGAMQVMLKLKDYNGSHVEGILLLDDDVVVQKDLTGHWEIDMNRKVNGGCRDLCWFVPLLERGQLLKADPYLRLREANITFPTES